MHLEGMRGSSCAPLKAARGRTAAHPGAARGAQWAAAQVFLFHFLLFFLFYFYFASKFEQNI
jgi:hypothetical protein